MVSIQNRTQSETDVFRCRLNHPRHASTPIPTTSKNDAPQQQTRSANKHIGFEYEQAVKNDQKKISSSGRNHKSRLKNLPKCSAWNANSASNSSGSSFSHC